MFTTIVVIVVLGSTQYTGEVVRTARGSQLIKGLDMGKNGAESGKSNEVTVRLAAWIATGLGLGHFPVAPGTVGSLLGLPLAWCVGQIPSVPLAAAVVVALCAVGVPIVNAALPRWGGRKDPGCVVYDEIASLPITFFFVPTTSWNWKVVALGFFLHRLFDITKPPPARQLEHLPGGLGVMADDWAAGVYSGAVLYGLMQWLPVAS